MGINSYTYINILVFTILFPPLPPLDDAFKNKMGTNKIEVAAALNRHLCAAKYYMGNSSEIP